MVRLGREIEDRTRQFTGRAEKKPPYNPVATTPGVVANMA